MDTYHKMLVKVYEAAGGRETNDVDFVEITKREGYFPSIDDIVSQLKSEGWVTESRRNILRLTHWGVAEAKKCSDARPDSARAIERETTGLIASARDLAVLGEEFSSDPVGKRFKPIESKLADIEKTVVNIRKLL